MKYISLLKTFSILFLLISPPFVFAEETSIPPQCIGNACLGEHIEKYKNRIENKIDDKSELGPIFVLKNDGRYVSAKHDESDDFYIFINESNWVQLSICESSRDTINKIYRTIKAEDDFEYYKLLSAYEIKYGEAKTPDYYDYYGPAHKWEWKNPAICLLLIKKRNSNYISIILSNLELLEKNIKCGAQEVLKMKTQENLVPE